jgi:hypothetical protein
MVINEGTVIIMVLDGNDLKYLLAKKGITLSDIAAECNVNASCVSLVVNNVGRSQRIISHIEKRLGLKPGEIELSKERRSELVKVA